MLAKIQHIKVEIDFRRQYSKQIKNLGCPKCKHDTPYKTRTYRSLKSLLYHLSVEHKHDDSYYPFTTNDIKTLMQSIAVSLEWGLLV